MKNWLTSLFLLFALVSGALAGTPVFSGRTENGMSATTCCQKKAKDCVAKSISAAQLCCAVNCGSPAPTSPGATFNSSPSVIIISDSILKQITLLLSSEKTVSKTSFSFERKTFLAKSQPKYIQHHSFLI